MIRRLAQALKSNVSQALDRSPRVVILAYHRVASGGLDPNQLCVSREHFEKQMRLVRDETQPIPLRELAVRLRAGDLRQASVVVTFDDGYADNWTNAAPILRDLGIPATFFVTSGMVDTGREFFADELIHLTLSAPIGPQELHGAVGAKVVGLTGEERPISTSHKTWTGEGPTPNDSLRREELYHRLHSLLREQNLESRESILTDLREQAARPPSPSCESHRTLSSAELRALAKEDLFEVGAHAVEHLVLRRLPAEEQAFQITESKTQLELILSRPVESFAYPYGSEWDVSPTTVDLVRQAGFRLACANVPGQVSRGSDPFWLPRYLVRDWGAAEFERRLRSFFVPRSAARPVSA